MLLTVIGVITFTATGIITYSIKETKRINKHKQYREAEKKIFKEKNKQK